MASALVLGGGFGGLAAAHELRRLLPADSTITLGAGVTASSSATQNCGIWLVSGHWSTARGG